MAGLKTCSGMGDCRSASFNRALHDVISQYQDSPNLRAYIASFIDEAVAAASDIEELSICLSFDCVAGSMLEVIGAIVGQIRPLIIDTLMPWFAFDGGSDPLHAGFGEGRFWDGHSTDTGMVPAPDDIYRQMIAARIMRNVSRCTHNDVLRVLEVVSCRNDWAIYGTNGIPGLVYQFDDTGEAGTGGLDRGQFTDDSGSIPAATMEIRIIGMLEPADPALVALIMNYDILPLPAGVKLVEIR